PCSEMVSRRLYPALSVQHRTPPMVKTSVYWRLQGYTPHGSSAWQLSSQYFCHSAVNWQHALISSIPSPVMGGISLLLFGIIAASGIRMLVESKVDYNRSQNLILTCVVLVIGISGATVEIGSVELTGMGLATIVAIVLGLFFKLLDVLKLSNE